MGNEVNRLRPTVAFSAAGLHAAAPPSQPDKSDGVLANVLHFVPEKTWRRTTPGIAMTRMLMNYGPVAALEAPALSAAFTRATDVDVANWPSFNYAAFPTELVALIKDPAVQAYLKAITTLVGDNQPPLDLWQLTLDYCHQDRAKAVQWLAVLFQDSSETYVHVEYLRASHPEIPSETCDLLERANELVRTGNVSRYPQGVTVASTAVYHFYVMAYAAAKVRAMGFSAARAEGSAVVCNDLYEYRKHDFSLGYSATLAPSSTEDVKGSLSLFFRLSDPPRLDSSQNTRDMFDDLYLGYAGATFGADPTATLLSRDAFVQEFTRNPAAFVASHFF